MLRRSALNAAIVMRLLGLPPTDAAAIHRGMDLNTRKEMHRVRDAIQFYLNKAFTQSTTTPSVALAMTFNVAHCVGAPLPGTEAALSTRPAHRTLLSRSDRVRLQRGASVAAEASFAAQTSDSPPPPTATMFDAKK